MMFTSTKYSFSIPYTYEEDIFSTLHTILQKKLKLSNATKIRQNYWQLIISWNYSVTWKNQRKDKRNTPSH